MREVTKSDMNRLLDITNDIEDNIDSANSEELEEIKLAYIRLKDALDSINKLKPNGDVRRDS